MPNRSRAARARQIHNTVNVVTTPALNALNELKDKFTRLLEVKRILQANKDLYKEQDRLTKELLPLFITIEDGKTITKHSITLGDKTYRLIENYYNPQEGMFLARQFKAAGFQPFTIEG